jgi:hypothetical protein
MKYQIIKSVCLAIEILRLGRLVATCGDMTKIFVKNQCKKTPNN